MEETGEMVIEKQWLSKHGSAAVNTNTTKQDLLETSVFYALPAKIIY
jgi:hypothetical protein